LLLLLYSGLSAKMRDRAGRFGAIGYWLQFLVVTTLLELPLAVYRDWYREHQYGLSNLTFAGWLGEEGKGFLISAVFGALVVSALYAVVRRLPRTWWVWGTVVAIVFLIFGVLIGPPVIQPIFNSPKRLEDQRVVAPILSMARANGIKAAEVWEIDASKQTTRISANVSGIFATERITLNDNLLARCSLPEIEAVMGHEMGHYVLGHIPGLIVQFGVVIAVGFALVSFLFGRFRARWNIADIGDVAGMPLALLLFSAYLFVLTPVLNSIVRSQENAADVFGVNASQQPDGFAQVTLKLSEYRKLEPGPLEEIVFFDHPSGRTRILTAMRWKAEHPETWKIGDTVPFSRYR
jgi:STE24 endopeptidase